MKRIPPTQIRKQPLNISKADRRMRLRFAFSQLCDACPPDLFTWLAIKFPKVHAELTTELPQNIDAAWNGGVRAEFNGAISKFLDAASVAIALHSLQGRR